MISKSKADRFKTAPQIKARRKPRLTSHHKKARLAFAKAHKDWTAEQCGLGLCSVMNQGLFRTEVMAGYSWNNKNNRVYVRRMAGEEFSQDCIQTTVKHGVLTPGLEGGRQT